MKIQISKGKLDETCTLERNLTENQIAKPQIREILEYAEIRMVSTLLVSGVMGPYGIKPGDGGPLVRTKIPVIPADKLIGGSAYKYPLMGRIQRPTPLMSYVTGSADANGFFQVVAKIGNLYPGMVARFYGGLQARVMTVPTGNDSTGIVYTFQTIDGSVFSPTLNFANQVGEKTCFGSYTNYEERSSRGYGYSYYPDMYVNHLGIQRKTIAISGSAGADETVIWYEYKGEKGWLLEKERQGRATFLMEDEYKKWFGVSTMRDAYGNVLNRSRIQSLDNGLDIIDGDGIVAQISGRNDAYGSGSNGQITATDVKDMMTTLKKRSKKVDNNMWYIVTGTDGIAAAQDIFQSQMIAQNHVQYSERSANDGNAQVKVGTFYPSFTYLGDTIVLVCHTLFDDEERFTERTALGQSKQSNTWYFIDASEDAGQRNIEILSKGANGVNRSMVTGYINGLSGFTGKGNVVTSVDGLEYNMLKDDGIFIYNTASCGILSPL